MSFVLGQKVLLHAVVEVGTRRAAREHERIDGGELTGCDEFDVKSPSKESLSARLRHLNLTQAPWSRQHKSYSRDESPSAC